MSVSTSVQRIRAALSALGRDELVRRLLPGIPELEVRRRLDEAGLGAPADVVQLFGATGGTRADPGTDLDSIHMFPGFYLLSLDEAMADYAAFRGDGRWREGWLPIFGNGGGDFYVVDTRAKPAHVVGFLLGETDHEIEFADARSMLLTIADCFEERIFFVDERGYLEMDSEQYVVVARRNNPSVEFWTP